MTSYNDSHNKVKEDDPLYNSRIIRVYIEYIKKHYPHLEIGSILSYAGITNYELEDQGHWFTQHQVDRFHEILVEKTGDPNISRKVGRYAASSGGMGPAKQFTLGLMSLTSVYLLMQKLYSIMSRGATLKVKKLGSNKVEIISIPKPGVIEKPYQCDNRIGTFESVAKLFTEKFATIEHPTCIHRGGDLCRYIITWEKTPSLIWKRVKNYSLLLGILVSLGLFFVLPLMPWISIVFLFSSLTLAFSFYSEYLEKKDLTKTIETQGDAVNGLLKVSHFRS